MASISSPNDEVDLEMNTMNTVAIPSKSHQRVRDDELRIIIFTACYFVLDGVTLTIRKLESHLRSRGATVKICTTVADDFDMTGEQDVIVVPGCRLAFTQAGSGYSFGANLIPEVVKQIEDFKPNCIHFTVPDFVSLDAIRWCQDNNIGYMATWHSNYLDYLKYYYLEGILGPALKAYLEAFYNQIPAVYAPTPFMLDKLKTMGFGGEGTATQYKEWGRGIDTKLFSPDRRSSEFRTSRGLSDDDVLLIWVGRLVPEKRPDIWMDVVQRLNDEGHACKGVVVGHGFSQNEMAQLENVHCLGWLSGVGLAEAYASADILLFPSDVETFGSVTLEALASGCPGVVEGGCSGHLVESGFNGFTCTAGDGEEFYEATKTLVTNSALRKEMSANARRSAWKYERNKILQQMAENYKDAIQNHADPKYLKNLIEEYPEVSGQNWLATLCCQYFVAKRLVEPFLDGSARMQDLVNWLNTLGNSSSSGCCASWSLASLSKCSCCSSACSCLPTSCTALPCSCGGKEKEEEAILAEEQGDLLAPSPSLSQRRSAGSMTLSFLLRATNFLAIVASYVIIAMFVYASFTV